MRTPRWPRRVNADSRGVALVEFALMLPLLAWLVFGVVDLGRAYRLKTELANAAREGAVYAQNFPARTDTDNGAPNCADPENVAFVVRNESGPPKAYNVAVTKASDGSAVTGCERQALAPGSGVVVSASAPFAVITPLVAAVVGRTLTLRASVHVVVQG